MRCKGTKDNGEPCKGSADETGYCRWHSPGTNTVGDYASKRGPAPAWFKLPTYLELAWRFQCIADDPKATISQELDALNALHRVVKDSKDEQYRLAELGEGHRFTMTYVSPPRQTMDATGPTEEKEIH